MLSNSARCPPPTGKIHVKWRATDANGEREFKLIWREFGGPPAVRPRKKGFGSAIIGKHDRPLGAWLGDGDLCGHRADLGIDRPRSRIDPNR